MHFPWDKSELLPEFRNNAETLRQIIDITSRILSDSNSSVKKIQIVGLASVEGSVAHNEQLSRDRAKSLQGYVQQQLHLPDSLFETVGGGEAWHDFRSQIEERCVSEPSHSDQLHRALTIIDSEKDPNLREKKLMSMENGKTWAYIKKNILKEQRYSGYVRVYYDHLPDTVATVVNRAIELLRTDCSDCHHEALRLLEGVSEDQRSQNALGVALYLCGRHDEALDCFRKAAAAGSSDARKNLLQIERNEKENR